MKNIIKDYAIFITILNDKFKFKDKNKFENDFLELIDSMKEGAIEQNVLMQKFFGLIFMNTSLKPEEIIENMLKETKALYG